MRIVGKMGMSDKANEIVQPAMKLATDFMISRYGNQFDDLGVIFTAYLTNSVYDRDIQVARIGVNPKWTHPKLKVALDLDYMLTTALVLIRQMTHHVQHLERRISTEVEVTKNELDFLSKADPQWNEFIGKLMIEVNATYKVWLKVRKLR